MYLVRNVFHAKPGMVKEMVRRWKIVMPVAEEQGLKHGRILTDVAANFWTFIYEFEVEKLSDFERELDLTSRPDVKKAMEGYMDLVQGGYREIFKIQ